MAGDDQNFRGYDPRPNPEQAKDDLVDQMYYKRNLNDYNDPKQNIGMTEKRGGWGAGVGPTPLNASNKEYEERTRYRGGGPDSR